MKIGSSCFNENTSATGNNVSGKHRFKTIHSPEECQVRCVKNDECAYFVVFTKGIWKGCWLKTEAAKRTVKTAKNAIFGPKYCTGMFIPDH